MSQDPGAAAAALKAAIDRHLEASAAKQGESDPAVQEAYEALREAAETYDDALFEAYDEVSPFEYSRGPVFPSAEVMDERIPVRLSFFGRRDLTVRSADDLLDAGAQLLRDEGAGDEVKDLTPLGALVLHLDLLGVDGTVEAADQIGLHFLGATTWLLASDLEDDTLQAAPFAAVDETRLLHRTDEDVIG